MSRDNNNMRYYTEESSLLRESAAAAAASYESNSNHRQREGEEERAVAAPAPAAEAVVDLEPEEEMNNDTESVSVSVSQSSLTQGGDADAETSILALMQRLRFLFGLITFPIVPLGMMALLALVWFLSTAFFLDNSGSPRLFPWVALHAPGWWTASSADDNAAAAAATAAHDEPVPCSHPLRAYAWASLVLVLYTPNHTHVRARVSSLRDRHRHPIFSGRRVDQLFHAAALLYVYAGISLLQTCNDDAVSLLNATTTTNNINGDMNNYTVAKLQQGESAVTLDASARAGPENSCQATCPIMTNSLTLYVAALELFTLSLILPLLCLPCVYLWFLRQATAAGVADPDTLAALHHRLRRDADDDVLFGGSGGEGEGSRRLSSSSSATGTAGEILLQLEPVKLMQEAPADGKISIISLDDTDGYGRVVGEAKDGALECCICMSDFYIYDNGELNDEDEDDLEVAQNNSVNEEEAIVRTPVCGHLFHKHCIASWVGGRWEPRQRTRLQLNDSSRPASISQDNGNSTAAAVNNNNANAGSTSRQRQRRARRTTCPLCRAELLSRGERSSRAHYNTFV